jgi:hypothetical protein
MFPFLDRLSREKSYFKVHELSRDGNATEVIGKNHSDYFFSFVVDSHGKLYSATYRSLARFSTHSLFGGKKKVISYDQANHFKDVDPKNPQNVYFTDCSAGNLVMDQSDNLYFSERYVPMMIEVLASGGMTERTSRARPYQILKKVTPAGVISTIAGSSSSTGAVEGAGEQVSFTDISAMCVDALGNLYAYERSQQAIRRITPSGVVTTLLPRSPELEDVLSLAWQDGSL